MIEEEGATRNRGNYFPRDSGVVEAEFKEAKRP